MSMNDPESLQLLAESVDRYVGDRFDINRHRAALETQGCDERAWQAMAEMGWMALTLPADMGGLGGGAAMLGVVMRAIGRGLVLEPYLATMLAAALIDATGDDGQRNALLPAIAEGTLRAAFAHQEPGTGFALKDIATNYAGGSVTGIKTAVLHGDVTELLVVSTRMPDGAMGVCMVRADEPHVDIRPHRLIDGRNAATIHFNAAPAQLLGEGDATAAIEQVRQRAAAAACAESVGAIGALNQLCLDYAKTRRQFGAPIGSFQVLQHRLVDMFIAEQEAIAVTNAAAAALDADAPDAAVHVASAKVRVGRAARFVGEAAIQIHGGIGMVDEYVAGHLFKRLLMLGAFYGDVDWHLDHLARLDTL